MGNPAVACRQERAPTTTKRAGITQPTSIPVGIKLVKLGAKITATAKSSSLMRVRGEGRKPGCTALFLADDPACMNAFSLCELEMLKARQA